MKLLSIFLFTLIVTGLEFQTFQDALDYDPESMAAPNCKNDDEYTQTYEAYDNQQHKVIEEGEVEMQEDHSILSQAKSNIVEAREYIVGLDEGMITLILEIVKEQESNEVQNQQPEKENNEEPAESNKQNEQQPVEESESDDDQDAFGWGEGEIPQLFLHSKKTKAHKNANAFLQLLSTNTSLKFKNKLNKIIAMATELESSLDSDDERRQRKLELCDQIIDEITNMLLFLEKIMNDIDFQVEALAIFRKKQQNIQEVAVSCDARVISYQDASLVEVQESPIKHEIKQKRKNNVSFLQIAMDDEEVQHHQLEYQRQVLLNQGMLGFLRNSGKQVKLIH